MQKAFENIVEKMKEEKASYFLTIANTGDEKLDAIYKEVANAIDNDIKIVNQVAEEYKSTEHINCTTEEVCEWVEKSVDSIRLVREPHRLRLFHIEEDRQYCPYCGKKIKVVE